MALDDRLPAELDGRTFWLEGRVSGLPEVRPGLVRFELVDIGSRHVGLPSRLRLSWYDGPRVEAGERWRLAVRLKRPHGLVNPQAFDYEAWLLARRIGANGSVKAGERLAASTGISDSKAAAAWAPSSRICPMCETSNRLAPWRVCWCSAIRPAGYCTGIW